MKRPHFLIYLCFLLISKCVTEQNTTYSSLPTESNITSLLPETNLHDESFQHCELIADSLKVFEDSSIKSKLLYITIEFKNGTQLPGSLKNSPMFKPLEWIRITGSQHSGILQLKPNYEILSLNSLAVQTERVGLKLQDKPLGCLRSVTVSEYKLIIRKFLFSKLKEEETEICNIGIENRNGYAEFYHTCCENESKNNITCHRIDKNDWMKTLDIVTYAIIILAILYCPFLIPTRFYKQKYSPTTFEYKPDRLIQVKVTKRTLSETKGIRSEPWWKNNHKQETLAFSKVAEMKKFQKIINELEENSVYELFISKLKLHIRNDEIISENQAPTSLLRTLYDAFVECGIRDKTRPRETTNKLSETKNIDCCNANIFGTELCGRYPWYKCLRTCMRILLSLVCCLPWVFRITVYFIYESDIRLTRQQAATDRNLELSFEENLTYFLTPIHILFLVCYGIIVLDYILFGFFIMKIKTGFKTMLRTSLQSMCNSSKKIVFKWAFRVLSAPLRKFGIFGFIIGPIYWIIAMPLVAIVFTVRVFPTIHLAFSLMWNFSSFFSKKSDCCTENPSSSWISRMLNEFEINNDSDKDGKSKAIDLKFRKIEIENRVLRFFMILIALLTAISFVILSVECIIFVIEVAVYTMIGLILNSSHAMQYVSVASIGWLYYNSCFNGVKELYSKYNKFVHNILTESDKNKKNVDDVAILKSEEQNNTAFKVQHASEEYTETIENNSGLICFTNGVVLFLDKYDTLYISKEFFFDVCTIQHPQCPGELSDHLITAFRRFISIILFLLFVTVIVLAFGDAYSVSISNQLLATVAGGFVPWLLMKSGMLFSNPAEPNFEHLEKNLNFKSCFEDKIKDNEELWHVSDIEVDDNKTRKLYCEEKNGTSNGINTNGKSNGINTNGADIKDRADHADIIIELPNHKSIDIGELAGLTQ